MRLGWIGTGIMGRSMCGHLMAAGHEMTVFSRTKAKAADLLGRGAIWADTPRDVAAASEVVFTMVGVPADVREVYFGANGLFSSVEACLQARARDAEPLFVDMTTTEPSLAVEIAAAARARHCAAIDAPVSGGDVGARNATLSIMIGGDDADVARARPLFEQMGKNIVHQGGPGAGQHTKMCNQIVIAGTMIGVCESLVYGARAGLDLETMLQSIKSGAAGCWTLENLAPRVIRRDFAPGFIAEHFIKDMGIALDEAKRMDLALPGLALVHQLYVAVKAQGHGRGGTQALMLALEALSASSSR
jgi:3-hydroxyisobutyrate dehydrogenase